MGIKSKIAIIFTVFGLASIVYPELDNYLLPPLTDTPARDICIEYKLNHITGDDMCVEIITSLQQEVREKGIQGIRNVPATLTCQNIDYAGNDKCIDSVNRIVAILPF